MIFDIKHFSTHDGPGIRTTVFLKGCPLSCLWCHNPESQSSQPELMYHPSLCIGCLECLKVCPQAAISQNGGSLHTDQKQCDLCGECVKVCFSAARELIGSQPSVHEILKEIKKDISFYDQSDGGVTFSGGEPLLQPMILLDLLKACKELDIHTTVDTSGYASQEVFQELLPWVDLFLYDLKAMDETLHKRLTGVSNQLILENLIWLSKLGKKVIIRVPVVPGFNDSPQEMQQLATFAAGLPSLSGIELLPYHPIGMEKYSRLQRVYTLKETIAPSEENLQKMANFLRNFHLEVQIGG
jgi:pyruvate formate lyase activating enzyme